MEKHIKVYYAIWTEEDIEFGDTNNKGQEEDINCTPDLYDIEDNITAVDIAVKELNSVSAWDISSSFYHEDIWYSSHEDSYTKDEHTCKSYHLYGFTLEEQAKVYARMKV